MVDGPDPVIVALRLDADAAVVALGDPLVVLTARVGTELMRREDRVDGTGGVADEDVG